MPSVQRCTRASCCATSLTMSGLMSRCQLLRCQYLYFCTSKASKLRTFNSTHSSTPYPPENRSDAANFASRWFWTYSAAPQVSARQHTSAYVSIRVIRQHTSAYVSIRQHRPGGSGRILPLLRCQYLQCCTSKASTVVLVKQVLLY
jgi:hypothetical protein